MTPLKDPSNQDPWAYYYFHFNDNAADYNGHPISSACKGKNVLMAHLELLGLERAICYDDPGIKEYFYILGY